MHSGIDEHVQYADGRHARDQGNRNISSRVFYFAADHVEIVPSVIRPERSDQRGHEAGDAAFRAGKCSGEVAPAATSRVARAAEADNYDANDNGDFEQREDELEFSGFLDAEIIQNRNQNRSGDGDELSASDDERISDEIGRKHCIIEERKNLKRPENADQSSRDGRNGRGLRDHEPGPGVQESAERPVGVADVNIFSASLRLHGSQFGVGECSEER